MREDIEKIFFSRLIEAPAREAIDRLINGITPLERDHWTSIILFFIASRVRTPENVARIRSQGRAFLERTLAEPDANFDLLKGESPARNLLEWAQLHVPDGLANWPIELLPRIVFDECLYNKFLKMEWMLVSLKPKDDFQALLSDRPVVAISSIDHPLHLQALPLSPMHILFASTSRSVLMALRKRRPSDVVKMLNESIVGQAAMFAFGQASPRFFERVLPRGANMSKESLHSR
jgi:hypothetical protein